MTKLAATLHILFSAPAAVCVLVCTGTMSDCFLSFVAAQVPTCSLFYQQLYLFSFTLQLSHYTTLKKKEHRLPWWLSDKESAGKTRSIPDPGGFHMCRATNNYQAPQLLSLRSATREATAVSPGTATIEQLPFDATREKAKTKYTRKSYS